MRGTVSHDRYLLRRLATRVLHVAAGRIHPFGGGYAEFLARADRTSPAEDRAAQRLLLETRLAQLSAALVTARPEAKAQLDQEFISASRELRRLKEMS